MKKLILSVLVGMMAFVMQAQGVKFGLEAGYVYNAFAGSDYDTSGRSGYIFGATLDISLPSYLTLGTAVEFVSKGGSEYGNDMRGSNICALNDMMLNYVQVPVTIGRHFSLAPGLKLTPKAGWYFAVGTAGHGHIATNNGLNAFVASFETSHFGSAAVPQATYEACKRFDTGLRLGVDLTYRHIGLSLNYQYGVTPVTYYGHAHNSTLTVAVGYKF